MFKRSDADYLRDILEGGERILSYCRDLTYDRFILDAKSQDAVIRNFEIIGEAAKNINKTVQTEFSQIPWKNIMGMRDRLIHKYFGVNLDIVWSVATEDVPALMKAIKTMIDSIDKPQ